MISQIRNMAQYHYNQVIKGQVTTLDVLQVNDLHSSEIQGHEK